MSPVPPPIPEERRQKANDRRQARRDGKYDRRKNTCVSCQYFEPGASDPGFCPQHHIPMASTAFACVLFAQKEPLG